MSFDSHQDTPNLLIFMVFTMACLCVLGCQVVAARLYKEGPLRELFQAYIRRAPIHDKHVVEAVVADLRVELDVRG